ncbi:multifunctional CCA tRNA nucleotidyl transferase/2'3'-cyclic phosphodiesterase/2'nucleotidase/phosphatase [Idiomarina sp. WRN-38]|uniref:multifunctional CCA tRNA nucleotidyl transferase/2'3'-cyclic phosphodiesterase/2'nucleotidase/phosphatase n=1 Tax=Idiomarina sp. OXR-189 TaxID=3100175 RepID=UPI000733971B|nr:multifunctional CCA tRNA nucleotidyl transferase/2'3'-cyclic phosphodiesterase/2'nucleotidase/phosphatase [Idiomarina sp. OXR-189]KTG30076.1 tRNA nucleotidyltransferase [Idiomarina sp. H105]OAF14469.1 multifunctional CCA tRNA nucleotidyl transferase/2'3'-cyclic phosphodiesterase/2'nucleotidase/phosphatase [Idiomarina sp. WRN-38]WPZ01952.1 multifunctional CCA tRNA nucleotidyl transferase/2'3'-cyclic phosphodiesterase/2'nucleotidase/phosphatase [Idiomarina sp. OXR-189]
MQTYLVGGAVRDKLLGLAVKERDWVVVGATPQQMLDQGFQQVGKDFPVFLHPLTREEYALARTERKNGKGYKGFDVFASPDVTLEDDLVRRDLTINAIAEDEHGQLIDPYGGQRDIEQKKLRHVSPAFEEDPLRVLRVARFAARFKHLGFTIADETHELLVKIAHSGELEALTPERVWLEWEKSLGTGNPDVFLSTLADIGGLNQVLKQFKAKSSNLNRLYKSAQFSVSHTELTKPLIFASLFIGESPVENIPGFCKVLAIPNEYRDAAVLAERNSDFILSTKLPNAEQFAEALQSIDYWRRPEKLQQLLLLRQLEHEETKFSEHIVEQNKQLAQAAIKASEVSPQALISEGFTGKQLGLAIKEKRLETLTHQLKQTL